MEQAIWTAFPDMHYETSWRKDTILMKKLGLMPRPLLQSKDHCIYHASINCWQIRLWSKGIDVPRFSIQDCINEVKTEKTIPKYYEVLNWLESTGAVAEVYFPYVGTKQELDEAQTELARNIPRYKCGGYTVVLDDRSLDKNKINDGSLEKIEEIKGILDEDKAFIGAIRITDTYPPFGKWVYKEGGRQYISPNSTATYHAVVVIGYGKIYATDEKEVLIFLNSEGENFGSDGFGFMQFEVLCKAIRIALPKEEKKENEPVGEAVRGRRKRGGKNHASGSGKKQATNTR